MDYKQLSLAERYYIQLERKLGKSYAEIACNLGRAPSTISREVRRNTGLCGYRHQQADRLARQRHENKPKSLKLTPEIKFIVDVCLRSYWSPEQIAGRFKAMKVISLHHETTSISSRINAREDSCTPIYATRTKPTGNVMVPHTIGPASLTAEILISDRLKPITGHALGTGRQTRLSAISIRAPLSPWMNERASSDWPLRCHEKKLLIRPKPSILSLSR